MRCLLDTVCALVRYLHRRAIKYRKRQLQPIRGSRRSKRGCLRHPSHDLVRARVRQHKRNHAAALSCDNLKQRMSPGLEVLDIVHEIS